MLNLITIQGRLTSDPQYKETDRYKLANFTIACDRDFQKGKEKATDFVRCAAFGSTATFIDSHFGKGDMVVLTGRLQVDEDRDAKKSYYSIKVDNAYFAGPSKGKQDHSNGVDVYVSDEIDIPF